jgi:hypothetical protein
MIESGSMRASAAWILAGVAAASADCSPSKATAPGPGDALSVDVQEAGSEPTDAASNPDAVVGHDGASGDDGGVTLDATASGDTGGATLDASALSWVSLGRAPTPISLTREVDTPAYHMMLLYESTASMVIATTDKATLRNRERIVGGTKIAYASLADALDPTIAWIATSLPSALLRYDLAGDAIDVAASFAPDSHCFDVAQGLGNDLFIGTYPGGRLLRVPRDAPWTVQEITAPRALAGTRPYLHDVFAGGSLLYLHYAAPGILIRHDLITNTSSVVLSSTVAFLDFTKSDRGLTVSDGVRTLSFDSNGNAVPGPIVHDVPLTGTVLRDHVELTLGSSTATVSLAPRSTGMAIRYFGRTRERPEIIGGTYWNHWVFSVEPGPVLYGWGALPGASGEFFSIGFLDGLIAIPNYQGDLYLFDPLGPQASPDETETPAAMKILHVDRAHFGTATADDGHGTLFYATNPNYDQEGGMLVRVDAQRRSTVRDRLEQNATVSALAFNNGVLYGGTETARGLGIGPPIAQPVRIFSFDATTLATTATLTCGGFGDRMRALIPQPGQSLAGVTAEGILVRVDTAGQLACSTIGAVTENVVAAVENQGHVFLLTASRVLEWDPSSNVQVVRGSSPPSAAFLAISDSGQFFAASPTAVFRSDP